MIDYLMKFASEDVAKADPLVGSYFENGVWRGDICIPNVMVWDKTFDTTANDAAGHPVVTHQYQPFWYVTISSQAAVDALLQSLACALAVDWSIPGVLKSDIPANELGNYFLQPVFAGRDLQTLIASFPQ